MRNDMKIGIILGIVLAVSAVIYFTHDNGSSTDPISDPSGAVDSTDDGNNEDSGVSLVQEQNGDVTDSNTSDQGSETNAGQGGRGEVIVNLPPNDDTVDGGTDNGTPDVDAGAGDTGGSAVPDDEIVDASKVQDPDVGPRYYTVKKGDSLYGIAEDFFGEGNGHYCNEIYKINKSVIGSSPSKVSVGMKLRIPRASELVK